MCQQACTWRRLLAARNLALHTLDVKVDAVEELIVDHGVLGEQELALVVDDWAFPDDEAAILKARLDVFDMLLHVLRNVVGQPNQVDRAFLDPPTRRCRWSRCPRTSLVALV